MPAVSKTGHVSIAMGTYYVMFATSADRFDRSYVLRGTLIASGQVSAFGHVPDARPVLVNKIALFKSFLELLHLCFRSKYALRYASARALVKRPGLTSSQLYRYCLLGYCENPTHLFCLKQRRIVYF